MTDNLFPALYGPDILNWRMVPDVLLLGAVFFLLYRTLRSMGTLKIALGLVLAALVFMLASLLGLRGVEWLFSNVSQVALIGLIIVFQPEIRKILERAAPVRWGHLESRREQVPFIVDEALFALSERRWGALVVLPGRDSVQAWASQGIEADATPSFPLLLSLFDPDSPGHDGAAIIDGGRLTRFAVRLPLSESQRLSERLGTRHHAAMGLSEATDALVIAVSEERGTVSLFKNGEMEVVNGKGDVAARIREHWANRTPARRPAGAGRRRWVPALEIVGSLLVAAAFWSTVVLSRTEVQEVYLTVPIEYAGLPASLSLGPERPAESRIRLAGPAPAIRSADLAGIRVVMDVGQAVPGRQRIGIDQDNVNLPKHLQLLSVEPEVLDLEFLSVAIRNVPIKPQLVGSLPDGLRLLSAEVEPATTEVLIPVGNGDQAEVQLMTAPIFLPAIQEDTRILAKIVAPPGVAPTDRRWPDVTVEVKLEGALKKRE